MRGAREVKTRRHACPCRIVFLVVAGGHELKLRVVINAKAEINELAQAEKA